MSTFKMKTTSQENSCAFVVQEHTVNMHCTEGSFCIGNFNLAEIALEEKALCEKDIRLTGSDELQKT